jgi:phosphatidylserine decarboxylase
MPPDIDTDHMNKLFFLLLQHLAPHHALSRVIGWIANSRWAPVKNTFIGWFVKRYHVNMDEALCTDPIQYRTFNDFFTRALKPDARVIDADERSIVSPADGCISQLGPIHADRLLQAKGRDFSLTNLLGGIPALAEPFQEGSFFTVYLSPRDYHRVHMPLTGTLQRMIHVPGKLFSVNQLSSEHVDGLFARNERVVCYFETEFGPMALILVGAMIVASVDTVWAGQVCPRRGLQTDILYDKHTPPITISKGEEMGRFKLGSTVIAIFGPGMASLAAGLAAGDGVQMGERLGTLTATTQTESSDKEPAASE